MTNRIIYYKEIKRKEQSVWVCVCVRESEREGKRKKRLGGEVNKKNTKISNYCHLECIICEARKRQSHCKALRAKQSKAWKQEKPNKKKQEQLFMANENAIQQNNTQNIKLRKNLLNDLLNISSHSLNILWTFGLVILPSVLTTIYIQHNYSLLFVAVFFLLIFVLFCNADRVNLNTQTPF